MNDNRHYITENVVLGVTCYEADGRYYFASPERTVRTDRLFNAFEIDYDAAVGYIARTAEGDIEVLYHII